MPIDSFASAQTQSSFSTMTVFVRYCGQGRSSVSCSVIKRRAHRMLRALDLPKGELSVMLCDDSTIQELNRRYRQEDRPTDVLAFSMAEGEPIAGSSSLLGDVVISLSTAGRQATDNRQELLVEVTTLLAHGLLHLMGFDHRTHAQQRRMNARVDMLIAAAIGE